MTQVTSAQGHFTESSMTQVTNALGLSSHAPGQEFALDIDVCHEAYVAHHLVVEPAAGVSAAGG